MHRLWESKFEEETASGQVALRSTLCLVHGERVQPESLGHV